MSFKKITTYITLLLISLLGPISQDVKANNVVMYAKMDSSAIWQGEQISIKLEVVQDKDAQVEVLIPQNNLTDEIEIIKVTDGDTIDIKNNRIQIDREIIITSFDSGFYSIPSIKSVLKSALSFVILDLSFSSKNLNPSASEWYPILGSTKHSLIIFSEF